MASKRKTDGKLAAIRVQLEALLSAAAPNTPKVVQKYSALCKMVHNQEAANSLIDIRLRPTLVLILASREALPILQAFGLRPIPKAEPALAC